MLAGFLVGPKRIEIREIETPTPSKGEVLVKIKTALTCGTDLKAYLRGHQMIPTPGVFGHEFSGIVASVGKGVKKFKAGDKIMAVHTAPCLKCSYCKREEFNLCEKIMDSKVLGAFAEYLLIPSHIVEQNMLKKPLNLSFEEASFLEPLSCVVHGINEINIGNNDRVLIIGAGPIGLLHLMMARSKGAKVIIAGFEEKRLSLARELGAEMAVMPHELAHTVEEFTKGLGVDCVIECTGQAEVWESSVNYARRGGTVILFGGCRAGTQVAYDAGRLHYDEITLKGVFHFTPRDVKTAYRLLKDKKFKVSGLVTKSYPLKELPDVFEGLARAEGIKYAIIP